jgi:uncharacterized protein (TIGR02145 family)
MKWPFFSLTILALASLPSSAAISGTVTDRLGNGLAGVNVSLQLSGTSATSDAHGAWSVGATGIGSRPVTKSLARWTGKAMELTLTQPSMVTVEAFDFKGATRSLLSSARLDAGSHSIPLALPASGLVWLRLTVNGRTETLLTGMGRSSVAAVSVKIAARSQSVMDTLRFTWRSKIVAMVPVMNRDTSGIVVGFDTDSSIAWNDSIVYGSLYDNRDGQVYRTVKIGSQVWMAQNLNYSVDSSWWYKGIDHNHQNWMGNFDSINENLTHGMKYNRLYKWAAIMGLPDSCNVNWCITPDSCKTWACGDNAFQSYRGICPSGWHVPRESECAILILTVEADTRVGPGNGGRALKATSSWESFGSASSAEDYSGWDWFGFRALPAGYRDSMGNFYQAGDEGYWWNASENAAVAGNRMMYFHRPDVGYNGDSKTNAASLRCLKD